MREVAQKLFDALQSMQVTHGKDHERCWCVANPVKEWTEHCRAIQHEERCLVAQAATKLAIKAGIGVLDGSQAPDVG